MKKAVDKTVLNRLDIVVGGHGVSIQQDRILAWGTVEARATLQSRVADARAHDLDAPVQLNGIRLQPHSRIDHVISGDPSARKIMAPSSSYWTMHRRHAHARRQASLFCPRRSPSQSAGKIRQDITERPGASPYAREIKNPLYKLDELVKIHLLDRLVYSAARALH